MKLYKWQEDAIVTSLKRSCLALLADVGTGKTCAMINILRNKPHGKVLIFAPSVVVENWKLEFEKFSPGTFKVLCLNATNRKKFTRESTVDVVVTNFEAVQSDTFFKEIFLWGAGTVVVDELHRIKNHKSKRAKAIVDLGDRATYRYGLTGTAILNSPLDIFMQWRFLDRGETFGKSFFAFRALYFIDANAAWSNRPMHFPKFVPIESKFQELNDKIYRHAIRVKKEECLDLPPFIEKDYFVEATKEQKRMYKQMTDEFLTYVDDPKNVAVANIALTKALRLMQICAGHITGADGEVIKFKENPKLDTLMEILEDILPHKIIIWCCFTADVGTITDALKKQKIDYASLTGDTNDKQAEIARFQTEPDCKIMVANRKAGGIGVNLTEAPYSIVFSRNFSLEEELQSDGRNYRGGSEKHEKIVKINLVIKETVDEIVLQAVKGKEQISTKIIDELRRM